jgi:hypothetical protein
MKRGRVAADVSEDDGGESACFAHLICPECGGVLNDVGHLQVCTSEDAEISSRDTRGLKSAPQN